MTVKTRLDLLVRLREQAEEAARVAHARAAAALRAAQEREAALRAAMARERDDARPTIADDWHLIEASQRRAMRAIEEAQAKVLEAQGAERSAKAALDEAHRSAEAVRRAADAKRAELRLELERKERKELDGIAQMLHAHRRK